MTDDLHSADEGKPTCARCSKAGYTCAGYEKKLQFRHTYAEEVKDGAPKDKDKQPSPETIILLNLAHSRERSVQEQQHQALGRPPAQELSLVAFQPNIEFSFLFDHFVWRTYGTPWLDLAAAGKLGDLSASASRSLAQSTFGQSYHQPAIELSGAIHYSKTLKSLIPRLEDPKKPGIEMLIVPIMIMLNRAVRKTRIFYHDSACYKDISKAHSYSLYSNITDQNLQS